MGLWEGRSAYQYQIRETPCLYTFVCVHAPCMTGGIAYMHDTMYIALLMLHTCLIVICVWVSQHCVPSTCTCLLYRKVRAAQIHLFMSSSLQELPA